MRVAILKYLQETDRLGNKEVMPMQDSSTRMGHLIGVSRLSAGAVL
jgi:hypothetical protein